MSVSSNFKLLIKLLCVAMRTWSLIFILVCLVISRGCAWKDEEIIRVLSPYNNATLVASSVMILIQLPIPGYQLNDNDWHLCIKIYFSGAEEEFCVNDYSQSSLDATNNTAGFFIHTEGDFLLKVSLKPLPSQHRMSSDDSTYTVVSRFSITSPYITTGSSSPTNTNIHHGHASIADFTYLNDNSFDMIRMRLREHQPDALLLVDTNETHSGILEKQYVIPPSTTGTRRHSSSILEIPAQEFADITHIEPWYFERAGQGAKTSSSAAAGKVRILVGHPPSAVSNPQNREPINRNIVASLAKQLHAEKKNECGQSLVADYGCEITPLSVPDFYIISDSDEIVHRRAIRSVKEHPELLRGIKNTRDTVVFMLLDFHVYNFNWKFPDQKWGLRAKEGAYIAPASLVRRLTSGTDAGNGRGANAVDSTGNKDSSSSKNREVPHNHGITASGVRRLLRTENRQLLLQLASEYNIVYWNDAGWHFSQFYSPTEFVRARKSAFTNPGAEFMNKMWTEENSALMQEMGVPYFMLDLGKSGINYMLEGGSSLQFQTLPAGPSPAGLSDSDSVEKCAQQGDCASEEVEAQLGGQSGVHVPEVNVLGSANLAIIDAWEKQHQVTLPLATYEDRALFQRNIHPNYGKNGPSIESRRVAAENLVAQYSAALSPAQQASGRIVYNAPPQSGTRFSFACYSNSVPLDNTGSQEKRTLTEQTEDVDSRTAMYRAEVLEKLFCDDKARCPYIQTEEAIHLSINLIFEKCKQNNGGTVSINVHAE